MSKYFFLIFLFFSYTIMLSQSNFTIEGTFAQASYKKIELKGFTILGDSLLAKTTADAQGKFKLKYSDYVGAALVKIEDGKSVILLLNHENFKIKWDNTDDLSTLHFEYSPENNALSNGLKLYEQTEGKRAGLYYLLPFYAKEPLKFANLKKEIALQDKGMLSFFSCLPQKGYASYYIKLRKLLSDMPQTASRYIERLPENEKEFNSIDFSDVRLVQSGLYGDLIAGYFTLVESYVGSSSEHVNPSIDCLIRSLKSKPLLLQDVSRKLFEFFEKRSQFPAAEHLALAMLDDNSCQLDDKHKSLFEQYRKMAIGRIASDIIFPFPVKGINKLSEIQSKYSLVVFGASWCNKCAEELPKLKPYYENWKNKDGVEIVFVSLDQDKTAFEDFTKDFTWISSCDYKSWDGIAVQDYCVFASPTMYLLDSDQKILLKPISANHLEAWLQMARGVTNQ